MFQHLVLRIFFRTVNFGDKFIYLLSVIRSMKACFSDPCPAMSKSLCFRNIIERVKALLIITCHNKACCQLTSSWKKFNTFWTIVLPLPNHSPLIRHSRWPFSYFSFISDFVVAGFVPNRFGFIYDNTIETSSAVGIDGVHFFEALKAFWTQYFYDLVFDTMTSRIDFQVVGKSPSLGVLLTCCYSVILMRPILVDMLKGRRDQEIFKLWSNIYLKFSCSNQLLLRGNVLGNEQIYQ